MFNNPNSIMLVELREQKRNDNQVTKSNSLFIFSLKYMDIDE